MSSVGKENRNYIQRALGRRVNFLGIPWNLCFIEVGIAYAIYHLGGGYIAVFLLALGWFVTRQLFNCDRHPIRALRLWWFHGRQSYDSGCRYFHNAKEEPWFRYAITAKRFYARVTFRN